MLQGNRLRELRLSQNYTHEQLAKLMDLGIRQVARYESGHNDPTGEVIARIADVFNVSTDYLLGRTDDPKPCNQAADLTPQEQQILAALRRGEKIEAIRLIVIYDGE
jgi:transcriptional regulator with XRE-family HTH domain